MILKGNQRAGGIDLAIHLLNSFDNDSVEVKAIRGTVARDLLGAFSEIEAIASGTRCRQPLYSLSINPPKKLTPTQYETAIARIENELGLSGQPRAIVMHQKNGRQHCHVVWSRIDFCKMQAIHLSHDRLKLKKLARELAAQFGLALPPGLKERQDRTLAENAIAAQTSVTPEQRRHEITEAYLSSDNAASFQAALGELGYRLARGDKRGFVVLDRYGHVHSLTRQIKGVRSKHILERFAPLTPEQLPHIDQLTTPDENHDQAHFDQIKSRLSRLLRQNNARRSAALYRDGQTLENRQAGELRAVEAAQRREQGRPFARFASAVLRLLRSYPALRSVLAPIRRLSGLSLAERHAAELQCLRRRHNREWQEFSRRQRLLRLLHKKEQQSLDNTIRCALRRRKRQADMLRITALDMTAPSIFSEHAHRDGKTLDPELAALEREYQGAALSLTAAFNEAVIGPSAGSGDDSDDRQPPSYASRFNDKAT